MRIDAHHHLWKYNDRDYLWMSGDMDALRRDHLIPELADVCRSGGIDGTVAVQARQTVEETRWLLQLARSTELIRGVVGWVPLVEADVRRHLDTFAVDRKLKGVRHVLHDEQDDLYMLRPDFNRGVGLLKDYGLTYDLLVFERHLPQTIEFVDRHPDQVFILDHIAKPRIRDGVLSPWRERMGELGRRENVYCKVSGMVTEADWKSWTPDALTPYFDVVRSAFGPKRLMFGSDWPVLNLAGDYRRWVDLVARAFGGLSEHEKTQVWGRAAITAYHL